MTKDRAVNVIVSRIGEPARNGNRWYEVMSVNVEPEFSGWIMTSDPEQPGGCG
jgi:hypothetical protein